MKKLTFRLTAFLFILCMTVTPALAATSLIPVGRVIGLELCDGTVTVAGFAGESPAKTAGVQEGDCILAVDGIPVANAKGVREALCHSKGRVSLTLRRGKKEETVLLSPTITADGPKLGVYLKEGVTGIGTVTYYDPETGCFAALGHGVNTPDGKLLRLTCGSVYDARVASVRKGKPGAPGQLVGAVTGTQPVGSLEKNTDQGVFGDISCSYGGEALPVASSDQIKTGKATIRSTVSGGQVQEYSVEILKIYASANNTDRNMLIRVTDPTLLNTTGGIVQGMSGSPIIQDGKLVGAVTHVLVNDPTTGYGIFIENMLDAAA